MVLITCEQILANWFPLMIIRILEGNMLGGGLLPHEFVKSGCQAQKHHRILNCLDAISALHSNIINRNLNVS
jgi:hypothetical protein